MDELVVLRTGYDRLVALAADLTASDLDRPTPCRDWNVRELLRHVVSAGDGLVALLRGQEPDWTADTVGDDPAGAVRRSIEESWAAWSVPGAVDVPTRQMPGMRVVDLAMCDAVAHAWDLSAALGRHWKVDDDVVRVVHDRWAGPPVEGGRQYGVFGPQVPVAADRPLLDRFVGLLGRDPDWQPPTS